MVYHLASPTPCLTRKARSVPYSRRRVRSCEGEPKFSLGRLIFRQADEMFDYISGHRMSYVEAELGRIRPCDPP
jgi:hypothetical protein